MKLLYLYKWIAGTMADFTKPFRENETLYNQARAFWGRLEASSMMIFAICIVLGFAMAYIYYRPFNDKPGRHYKPKYWWLFLFATVVLTLLVTLGCEYAIAQPKIEGSFLLELKIAVGNALYSLIVYFIVSLIWCRSKFSTNAYRRIVIFGWRL